MNNGEIFRCIFAFQLFDLVGGTKTVGTSSLMIGTMPLTKVGKVITNLVPAMSYSNRKGVDMRNY